MSRRVVPVDRLAQEISKIMGEYGENVQQNLDQIVTEMTKKGARANNQQAGQTFNGNKYRKSWTSQVETSRVSAQGTIYSKIPGLPHLLEFGHALRQGGRTTGRPHIAAVEESLVKEFETKVKSKL